MYLYERTKWAYANAKERLSRMATGRRRQLCFKAIRLLFYGFVLFFMVNLIIVFLRERFELQGCALCIDEEVDRISALVQSQTDKFVRKQIEQGLTINSDGSHLMQAASHYFTRLLDRLIDFYEHEIVQRLTSL